MKHRLISDATIRRFLLAQLSEKQQAAFEVSLFSNSQLEDRVRLAEVELVDDYAAGRLKAKDRTALRQNFLVTTERERKLEVSSALQLVSAGELATSPARARRQTFIWPRLAWRVAFVVLALVVLVASALVIRKEPQIVRKFFPRRAQPPSVNAPNPQAAHHPTDSSGPEHRDETPALPPHEASPQTIVLHESATARGTTVVDLAQSGSEFVRIELMLERSESATFGIVVANNNGDIVHNIPEFRIDNAKRIDFDVAIDRLKAGGYHVTLKRIYDEPTTTATYYFQVRKP